MDFLRRFMKQLRRNFEIEAKSNPLYHFEFGQFHPLIVSAPEHNSDSNILNALNDDCLREVFKYLNLLDLSNVSDVCTRFNYLSNELFPFRYKHLHLSHNSEFFGRPMDVERLQRNFGSFIQSISVKTDVRTTGGFQGRLLILRPLLSKIKVLKLHGVGSSDELYGVLCVCMEIRTLHLDSFNLDKCIGKSIKRRFKQLEEVKFREIIGIADSDLHHFIVSNPQLTSLSILRNHLIRPTKAIRSIVKYLPKLECLEIDQISYYQNIDMFSANHFNFKQTILELSQLKHLKVLKLNFLLLPVGPLMRALVANAVPIEHLKLYLGEIDSNAINSISLMKQIKILEFRVNGLNDERLVEMVQQLPQLQELYFEGMDEPTTIGIKQILPNANQLTRLRLNYTHYITIDEKDYVTMLESIKNRPEPVKLTIEIINFGRKVLVPRSILLDNCKHLQIIEKIQRNMKLDLLGV